MTQQITMAADFMTSFYLHLSNELSKINREVKGRVYMVTSANHTQLRISGTKRDEVENDDVSLLIADIIKKNISYVGENIFTTRNENADGKFDSEITKDDYDINFNYADEHMVDIYGVKTFLTHGHQYKASANLHNVVSNRDNIIVDVAISGHWHSHTEDTTGSRGMFTKKKITLPSICGDTGFTRRLGYSSKPGALKITYNNKYGMIGSNFIPVD
jgi:predicted phosphodiesterase